MIDIEKSDRRGRKNMKRKSLPQMPGLRKLLMTSTPLVCVVQGHSVSKLASQTRDPPATDRLGWLGPKKSAPDRKEDCGATTRSRFDGRNGLRDRSWCRRAGKRSLTRSCVCACARVKMHQDPIISSPSSSSRDASRHSILAAGGIYHRRGFRLARVERLWCWSLATMSNHGPLFGASSARYLYQIPNTGSSSA
ncbi:hypothetical protein CI102_1115 [Trichoderma harzianum]|nr:hypothetical protein CI102_1115 [Trichoderma harzianum]